MKVFQRRNTTSTGTNVDTLPARCKRPQGNGGTSVMNCNLRWDPCLIKMSILHDVRSGTRDFEGGPPRTVGSCAEKVGVGIYIHKE